MVGNKNTLGKNFTSFPRYNFTPNTCAFPSLSPQVTLSPFSEPKASTVELLSGGRGFCLLFPPSPSFSILQCGFPRGWSPFWGLPAPAQAHPWAQSLWGGTSSIRDPPQTAVLSGSKDPPPLTLFSLLVFYFFFLFLSLSVVFCLFLSVLIEVPPTWLRDSGVPHGGCVGASRTDCV